MVVALHLGVLGSWARQNPVFNIMVLLQAWPAFVVPLQVGRCWAARVAAVKIATAKNSFFIWCLPV